VSDQDFVLWVNRKTGEVWRREFRENRELHRPEDEGPAVTELFENSGEVSAVEFYWEGKLHREDGPAIIHYHEDGGVWHEWYYRHGLLHRDPKEGPAEIQRDQLNADIAIDEKYCLFGKYYRRPEDGPYRIERHEATGAVTRQFTMTAEEASHPPQPPKGFPTQSTLRAPAPT
jgi:hypothetical protein